MGTTHSAAACVHASRCIHAAPAEQQQPAPPARSWADNAIVSRVITVAVTSAASALIAWGALQQQVKQIDTAGSTYMRGELKEIRAELQQIAIAQARAATALDILTQRKDQTK